LTVRVNRAYQFVTDPDAFFLLFLGVEYFEGPFHWKGVNFRLGSDDECQQLLHRTALSPKLIIEHLKLGRFSLFVLESDNFTVKIVAEFVKRIAIEYPSR
jgi:hypothetical protein